MDGNHKLKLTALSVADLAKLLNHGSNRTVSEEDVRQDIENGAPVNPDGTVNLINYTAWLVKEAANNDNNESIQTESLQTASD